MKINLKAVILAIGFLVAMPVMAQNSQSANPNQQQVQKHSHAYIMTAKGQSHERSNSDNNSDVEHCDS